MPVRVAPAVRALSPEEYRAYNGLWKDRERTDISPFFHRDPTGGDGVIDLKDAEGTAPQVYAPTIDSQPLGPGSVMAPGASIRQASTGPVRATPYRSAVATSATRTKDDRAVPESFGSTPQEKAQTIASRLMGDFGLTSEQAAGVVGNLWHETGGFTAYHETGQAPERGGIGWAQWTNSGDRRRQEFEDHSKLLGLDPASDEASYRFLSYELKTNYAPALEAVKRATTIEDASNAFLKKFEGTPAKTAAAGRRITAANNIYGDMQGPQLAGRRNNVFDASGTPIITADRFDPTSQLAAASLDADPGQVFAAAQAAYPTTAFAGPGVPPSADFVGDIAAPPRTSRGDDVREMRTQRARLNPPTTVATGATANIAQMKADIVALAARQIAAHPEQANEILAPLVQAGLVPPAAAPVQAAEWTPPSPEIQRAIGETRVGKLQYRSPPAGGIPYTQPAGKPAAPPVIAGRPQTPAATGFPAARQTTVAGRPEIPPATGFPAAKLAGTATTARETSPTVVASKPVRTLGGITVDPRSWAHDNKAPTATAKKEIQPGVKVGPVTAKAGATATSPTVEASKVMPEPKPFITALVESMMPERQVEEDRYTRDRATGRFVSPKVAITGTSATGSVPSVPSAEASGTAPSGPVKITGAGAETTAARNATADAGRMKQTNFPGKDDLPAAAPYTPPQTAMVRPSGMATGFPAAKQTTVASRPQTPAPTGFPAARLAPATEETGSWLPSMDTVNRGLDALGEVGEAGTKALKEVGKQALSTFAGAGPLERARIAAPSGREAFMTAGTFGGVNPQTEMQLQNEANKLFGPGGEFATKAPTSPASVPNTTMAPVQALPAPQDRTLDLSGTDTIMTGEMPSRAAAGAPTIRSDVTTPEWQNKTAVPATPPPPAAVLNPDRVKDDVIAPTTVTASPFVPLEEDRATREPTPAKKVASLPVPAAFGAPPAAIATPPAAVVAKPQVTISAPKPRRQQAPASRPAARLASPRATVTAQPQVQSRMVWSPRYGWVPSSWGSAYGSSFQSGSGYGSGGYGSSYGSGGYSPGSYGGAGGASVNQGTGGAYKQR